MKHQSTLLHLQSMIIDIALCVSQDMIYTGLVRLAVTEEHAACLGTLALPPLEVIIITVVVVIIVLIIK